VILPLVDQQAIAAGDIFADIKRLRDDYGVDDDLCGLERVVAG
jgi:hypothetical protein